MRYNLEIREMEEGKSGIIYVSALPVAYGNLEMLHRKANELGMQSFWVDAALQVLFKASNGRTNRLAYIDKDFSRELGKNVGVISVHAENQAAAERKVDTLVMGLGAALYDGANDAKLSEKYEAFEREHKPLIVSETLQFPERGKAKSAVI